MFHLRRFYVPARRLLAVLLAVAALMPLGTGPGPWPARAATASCTGWASKTVPPETIRVGRSDGTVEVVPLRRYVAVVTALEWPAWMPRAAVEAGATAVKQYAWFYALAGWHRSSYVNAIGQCFDVRDSTVDQLYKPERVGKVADRIWRSVDATLGLSVRKDGAFFLTGYRTGTSSTCASDADGTRLYAKSVRDCAEKGWTREQIQRAYYAPNVTFHWAEETDRSRGLNTPIKPPTIRLREGRSLGDMHARVSWDREGAKPDELRYQLQHRLNDGAWRTIPLPDAQQPWMNLAPKFRETHRFRVRLRDSRGNAGPWFTGPSFDARLAQDAHASWTWSARDWDEAETSAASGGTVTYADDDASRATLAFTGRAAAVVGTVGPNRGRARIYVDDVLEAEVDLEAPKTRWRVIIYSHKWGDPGAHRIRVQVVGNARVDVDALLIYR